MNKFFNITMAIITLMCVSVVVVLISAMDSVTTTSQVIWFLGGIATCSAVPYIIHKKYDLEKIFTEIIKLHN